MSSSRNDDDSRGSDGTGSSRQRHLEVVFEAFHDEHYPHWFGYAYLHTGTRAAARMVCHDLSRCLGASWPVVLEHKPASYSWKLLKEIVAVRLIDKDESVFVETAAFRATLEGKPSVDEQFRLMEQALSLYWGISRLPERQRDLLVLHYTLGLAPTAIATLLDEEPAVVGVQLDAATKRLSALLGTATDDRRPDLGE